MSIELPVFCLVGARPVKAVKTEEGGADILALDWETGELTRNMDYLRNVLWGEGDVEYLEEEQFDQAVEAIRQERGLAPAS